MDFTLLSRPHLGCTSHVGGAGVEMGVDFRTSGYSDVHVQTDIIRGGSLNEVLRQRLEHHHGGLEGDRERKEISSRAV